MYANLDLGLPTTVADTTLIRIAKLRGLGMMHW